MMTENSINNLEITENYDNMETAEVKPPVSKKTYKPRPDRREKVRELMVSVCHVCHVIII